MIRMRMRGLWGRRKMMMWGWGGTMMLNVGFVGEEEDDDVGVGGDDDDDDDDGCVKYT